MSASPANAEATALLFESPRLLSVEEYHRMSEARIFDENERVELLEGVILKVTPQSPSHARRIEWLNRFLAQGLGVGYVLRPQLPLTLGTKNEPEPDLAVVPEGASTDDHHPETAVLVIEVAGDSLQKDRKVKAAVYARFGIPEYWIVNLEARAVEVLWDPDPAGTYLQSRTCTTADRLTSVALPHLTLSVAELFS